VLVLVIGDDGGEVAEFQFLANLVHDDGAQSVEQLPCVEAELAVAAYIGNDIVEIFEDDVF
jgi:hypothetical protein